MQERSLRWMALNAQKKKTTNQDERNAISKEQAMLHAQNVADSKKIGARYERKTGEWTRTAGRGDNRHTESINGMRGMLGNPRELMQNSLPFQLGQQTGKVLYQGRNPKATLSDEDRAILHAMPTGQNAFQAFNQGTLGMQQPQSDHVASVKVTKRLSDAAASIGDTLVGMFPALAETGQQRAKNVAQERTQAGFTDLEAKQKQLQDALAVTPVSDSTGKLTDTYKALQAQLDEVNAQIERMSVNTPVDQSLFGQRKMRESREKAAAATVGMTGAGKFLADTGLSIANNAVTMPTALIHPSLPLLLMGTQAAASKTTELNERGAEPGEALARGLVSGGIEAATEKLPLENLLNTFATGAGKSVIRNLLKQSGTEAGEEAVSYVLNYIADKAAQDPEAQFSLAEMVQAAAGGAVSGGIMGGGALLGNYTMNRLGSNIESDLPTQPTMQERIQNEINDPESAVVDAQFDPEDIAPPVQQTAPQTIPDATVQETPIVQQETAPQVMQTQGTNTVQNVQEPAAPVQQTETAPMIGSNPEVRTMNQTDSYDVTGYTLSQDAIDLADELKQIGDVKTAVETLLPKYEALHDRALQDATDMPVDQVGKVDATESTGAAPAGFDPYSRAVNEYGAIEPGENPARVVDVPKSVDGETRVNRGARTILETAYTTDATRESIEKSIVETGIFSHGIATDKKAMEQATRVIRDKGFDGALQQWQDVTNGYQKADKNNLAMAIALYAASEKAGDTQLSTRLAAEIAAQGTLAGQEVQALRLLKKTTPEGQLYYMRKMVQGLNEKYEKRLEKRNNRQQNTTPDIQQETMDAFRQAQQEIDRNQEAPQNKSGTGRKQRRRGDTQNVPVEEWGTETGNDLAKRIADRLIPPQAQKPITRTILSDLLQFADEHALPKKEKAPVRTATDRLRDYFANKEFYVEALEQAQKVLQERYAGDQNALDALAAFNRGTIDYNNDSAHTQKVILRALMDDIRDSGGWKEYLGRDALGAREQNVQQLADRLIRDTGVSGSDAEILRDAVQRNYPDMASKRSGVQLESMIRSALKQNDLTMGDVARMNENDRAATGRAIAAYLTEQYGVASDYVQNVSDVIAEEYNAQVQQEIDRNQEAPQNKSGTGRKQRRRGDTQNVPVEEWGTETGNDLAKRIADRLIPPQAQKPITRTILSDLLQFADEHALPKKEKAPVRTATDRLRDYFANKEFYVEALEQAQKVLQERYAGDQNALDALAAFNRGTIDYNNDSAHTQKVILRALMDDIRDSGGWKEYLGRDALGAREQNVQQLADRLIRDTGVSGSDAEILRDAVQRNYPDMASKRSGVQLESMIRSALKQNDLTMGDVARMNENDRAATGRAIAAYLTEQYGVASDYVQNVSDVIAEEYNAQVQQRAHEILENRFKERGQRTPREFWDVFEEYANLGAFDGEYAQKATEKLFGYKNIILDESLARELVNTTDADARDEIIDRICRDIAEQIPGSWTQKADAIRYFSMLGRPTTHIRNIASNFMMVLPVSTKNKIGAVLEKALVKEADRTKSLTQADKATRDFAKADAERMKNVLQGGGNYSIEQMVRQYMQPFSNKHLLGKMLNKGSSLNSAALEFEDWIALGPQYRRALEGFIKARGLDVNTLIDENGNASAALEEARSYAIREAQKATFRDDSQIAAALNKFEKTSFLTRVLVGGEMPFKKTPINIVKRGIEYSPAGFLKAAKEFRDVHLGTKTMSEAIDTLASAITGTGLMAVGAALGSAGILHGAGSGDKKEQNLNSASGIQEYSIDLGALMNAIADDGEAIGLNMENFRVDENGGYTYTLDWTAPGSLPLFMGVEVYNAIWGDKADDSDAGAIAKFCEALLNITEPMFSMTMLNGIRSTLKSASYDDANPLTAALTSIVSSYAGQFVPSVLGSVARTIDDTRRTTYKNKSYTGELTLDLFLQKQQNKIPGLSKKNIPYMDVFGNTDTEPNTALRVFENFLSPGYLQKKENSEAISGLRDLYRETGDASVLPNKAATSFSVDGKTKNLTQDEYQTLAQTRGKMIEDGLADLFRSSAYQNMGSEERVNAVSELYKHANAAAKAEISDYPMSDTQKRAADSGVPLGTYYAYKQTLDNLNAAKDEDARIKTAQQIANDSSLTQNEKNTLMLDILLSSDDSIAKYHETFESEFDPQTYITLLNEKSKINKMYNDEDDSESKKEGAWVKYLKASDLTDAQKAKAEEEMKFYRQIPATAYIDSFEMLEEYGGKQERAAAQEMQDAGVTLDMHNTAKEYKSSLTGTGKGQKERVLQWMREQGWTEAQIAAEQKALYGESKGGSGGSSGGSSSGKSKNSKGGTGVKTPKIGIGLKLP